mgnify:CR=1 FL=1
MKYIIVGLHATGKQALARELAQMGVKVGKGFRSIENLKSTTYSLSEQVYEYEDVNNIFENQSYLFLKQYVNGSQVYYEGLSSFEFENNDVFIMSPDQFSSVPEFGGDMCFVWLDSSNNNRRIRHTVEKRRYSFLDQDRIEGENLKDFTERIYQNDVLYFNNEDVSRVAAILYCLVQHPELYDIFRERFN